MRVEWAADLMDAPAFVRPACAARAFPKAERRRLTRIYGWIPPMAANWEYLYEPFTRPNEQFTEHFNSHLNNRAAEG